MKMKPISTAEEYRKIIFDIMVYLDELSKKHDLNCMLSGGTLLGAVRHGGFIPWDDDADMMLLRKDYEKLIRLVNADQSPYRALCIHNDREYYYPFAKVVDTRTYLRQSGCIPFSSDGVCVDLFPLDDLPDDKQAVVRHYHIQKRLREHFQRHYNISTADEKNRLLIAWNRGCMRAVSRILEHRAKKQYTASSRYAGCSVMGYHLKEVMPKKELVQTVTLMFEGRKFAVPLGYDRYLSHLYGDYMTPPPASKRHNDHMAKAWYR